jgi:hypothetical protein
MNISEEKQFIYDMMRDVSKERRQLTDIYFGLKQRLDDLNKLEMRGLEDLSIKGYADLFNDHNRRTSVDNIRRETEHLVNNINREAEVFSNPQPSQSIPQHEISEQRYRDSSTSITTKPSKPKNVKRSGKTKVNQHNPQNKIRMKKIRKLVPEILKEEGIPMDARSVWEKLQTKDIDLGDLDINTFRGNNFYRVTRENENIEKVSTGFYQYKFS